MITWRAVWSRRQTPPHWQRRASSAADWWRCWCDTRSILNNYHTSSPRPICTPI